MRMSSFNISIFRPDSPRVVRLYTGTNSIMPPLRSEIKFAGSVVAPLKLSSLLQFNVARVIFVDGEVVRRVVNVGACRVGRSAPKMTWLALIVVSLVPAREGI